MVRSLSVFSLLKTTAKSAAAVVLGIFFFLPAMAADTPAYRGPVMAGQLAEPKNQETSGLTASHRMPGVLWTHNDSGGDPVLFAVNADGSLRGKVRVDGVHNFDWEDVASFELDGKAWLVAADIGDNFALRPTGCMLHVLTEPESVSLSPDRELTVAPAYSINFVYEDGARDAESLAVDVKERAIYLLSKREDIPRLYRLPLAPMTGSEPVVAKFVGLVPHLPKPTVLQRNVRLPSQGFRGWPTAMDFSHDGTLALVLVYEAPLLFPRAPGESWAEALSHEPVRLAPHELPQAEGACFSADDRAIFVASEKTMVLLRYDRTDAAAGLPAPKAPVGSGP
jgi:hypothetical protein